VSLITAYESGGYEYISSRGAEKLSFYFLL